MPRQEGQRTRNSSFRSPYRAEQGVGFHPVASFCRLKFGLAQYGVLRFSGSTSSSFTTKSESPPGTSNLSKYSVSVALSPYGTPFLRIYPGFIRVVTTLSVAPGGAPRAGPTPKPAGNSEVGYSQEPAETPCQSPLCPCGG